MRSRPAPYSAVFETAKALFAEVRALSAEAASVLVLEDPDDPASKAWQEVDQAYRRCVAERTKETDDPAIKAANNELIAAINLSQVCHQRLGRL